MSENKERVAKIKFIVDDCGIKVTTICEVPEKSNFTVGLLRGLEFEIVSMDESKIKLEVTNDTDLDKINNIFKIDINVNCLDSFGIPTELELARGEHKQFSSTIKSPGPNVNIECENIFARDRLYYE